MSIDKYRFVSPGVQVAEIDLSRRVRPTAEPGPVIIGRFERGPTMRPVRVESLAELEEVFGAAITGRESGDISRNGNFSAPSYAAFAANAWLANQGGATIVRLVGKQAEDAQTGGEAGWTMTNDVTGAGGAWGLWVVPSGSDKEMTGTLGAIFYCDGNTGIVLSGTLGEASTTGQASTTYIKSTDGNYRLRVVSGSDATSSVASAYDEDQSFNFNPQSSRFIRKVFNTTPFNTNSEVVATTSDSYKKYWLGETFEDRVNELAGTATEFYAFTAPLVSGSAVYVNHQIEAQPAKSPWVISQDVSTDTSSYAPENMTKLFRLVTLEEAEWTQRNLKISIRNIRLPNSASDANAYGSFDVLLRKIGDSDVAPEVVQAFPGVNLNPASPNYIANVIGDQYASWSDTEKRYRYFGSYPNRSQYVRVEMASAVEEGSITQELVPFGFLGLPKPATVEIEGDGTAGDGDKAFINDQASSKFVVDGNNLAARGAGALKTSGTMPITASLEWPSPKLVSSASMAALSDPTDRYFGIDYTRQGNTQFDMSIHDLFKARGGGLSDSNWDTTGNMTSSQHFSLDDVSGAVNPAVESAGYVYKAGSRSDGTSWTAVSGGAQAILDKGYDKFTMPLYGAFDGLDITEMAPLINNRKGSSPIHYDRAAATSYERYTLERAIDTVADPEIVDMNLLVVPGITDPGLTDRMINTCEQRRDAMAIIDLENAWTPRHESNDTSESSRNAYGLTANSVTEAVNKVKRKGYNTSYAAAYYPWVQVRAPVSGLPTWAPPSVVALGAMSYGQATQAVWFAPAGFTRGGLTEGRGGLPVVAVSQRLSSKERDKLYEVNINPIAQFPAEGIVIFGQKTLQATPSALDRINVRRLLIFIKKRISTIASRLLFEPNVSATWGRFTSQVVPLLDSIKTGFGLDDFRVVLDKTTTTDDLVDRNTMYAKIYVKPTKAVEFIAIDFVITNAGASFDD